MHTPAGVARPASTASLSFPLIDVLRAVAALMVVVYHVIEVGKWTSFPTVEPWRVFRIGWIGVDFFLVISGFVITLSALREFERSPTSYRSSFMARRLVRIFPLYLLTSLVFVLAVDRQLLSAPAEFQWLQYLSHLFFVHNLLPSTHGAINGPTWSIALEMQFYLLMVLAIPWFARQRLAVVATVLVLTAWAYRFGVTWILPPGTASPWVQMVYATQLPGTIDQFAMGILLALAVLRGTPWLARRLQPGWMNFGLTSLLALALFVLAMLIFWPRAWYWNNASMVIFWRTLLSMAFVCALAAAMTFPQPETVWLRPVRYLGEISYGIYLWHLPVLLVLMNTFKLAGTPLLLGVVLVACALAAASWHGMESPLMNRVRRRYAKS